MSNIIQCPYCDESNSETRQYCISCGKLIQLSIRERLPKLISTEQIAWVLIGGYSIYFILRYFIQLNFSIVLLISAISSFIMVYRLIMISEGQKLGDFFPYWKQFFFITGVIIWLIEFLSMITLDLSLNIPIENTLVLSIIPYTWEFSQGFSFGVIAPLFYYHYKNK